MTDSTPQSIPFSVELARELTTFGGQVGIEQALKWRLNEACNEIERLEEQHEALQQKYDALWQEQEHPFDKAEYVNLFEQLEAAREALSYAGRHLEDCCRSDIDWEEAMASHNDAVNALHDCEKLAGQGNAPKVSPPSGDECADCGHEHINGRSGSCSKFLCGCREWVAPVGSIPAINPDVSERGVGSESARAGQRVEAQGLAQSDSPASRSETSDPAKRPA